MNCLCSKNFSKPTGRPGAPPCSHSQADSTGWRQGVPDATYLTTKGFFLPLS